MPTISPVSAAASPTPPSLYSRPLPARRFQGNQFVYSRVSQRAGGLTIGINMNPGRWCNFDCIYCEIDRANNADQDTLVRVDIMLEEFERCLRAVHTGDLEALGYGGVPTELLPFKSVVLSGNGEPTQAPNFRQIVEALVHFRARRRYPFFKLVLVTNTTGLLRPEVLSGVKLFATEDEVWAKLDAGTQAYMDLVNKPCCRLEDVLENIARFARYRPVIIQSLFPLIDGQEPTEHEIREYAQRLNELRLHGAQIELVQVYSAHRPAMDHACAHLPMRTLSRIARTVREISGLRAEVY